MEWNKNIWSGVFGGLLCIIYNSFIYYSNTNPYSQIIRDSSIGHNIFLMIIYFLTGFIFVFVPTLIYDSLIGRITNESS
mgnify:FL=1